MYCNNSSCVQCNCKLVIAFYAVASYKLANSIRKLEQQSCEKEKAATEQHRQELADLYQAIVIATLLSGSSGSNTGAIEKIIKRFNEHYKGSVKLFQSNEN